MDDPLGFGALLPIGVDMGHNVVAHQLLPLLRHLVINILRMCSLSSAICSSVIGSPSSFSVSARAIHSFLQVRNFLSGEKIYCISLLAYRSESGL